MLREERLGLIWTDVVKVEQDRDIWSRRIKAMGPCPESDKGKMRWDALKTWGNGLVRSTTIENAEQYKRMQKKNLTESSIHGVLNSNLVF